MPKERAGSRWTWLLGLLWDRRDIWRQPWRAGVTLVSGALLVAMAAVVPFVKLDSLRGLIGDGVAFISLLVAVITATYGLRGKGHLAPSATSQPEPRHRPQPGGLLYVGVVLLMAAWWITSTEVAGTGLGSLVRTILHDPTVRPQLELCIAALVWVGGTHGVRPMAGSQGRWVASAATFLCAQAMMIGDTDWQYLYKPQDPLTHGEWLHWRVLNYMLIVPFLSACILVLHGVRLKLLAGLGCIGIPAAFILTVASGNTP